MIRAGSGVGGPRIAAPLGALLLLFAAPPALACSCAAQSAQKVIAGHAYAFIGTVVEADFGRDPEGREASVMRVKVDRPLKGRLSGIVTLYSPPQAAACGVLYAVGRKARFAAGGRPAFLRTDSCTMFNLNRQPPTRG